MRLNRFIFLILLLSPFSLMAQFGYLFQSNDSISSAVFIDQGHKKNTKECLVLKYDSITRYSPDEIYGYYIKKGPRYFSKSIEVDGEYKKYFLEMIGETDHKVFYLNHGTKRFFIEITKDSLYEIKSTENGRCLDFDDHLARLFDQCEYITSQIKNVKFSKPSMSLFVKRYKDCIKKPFPHFRYGAFAGYGKYQYNMNINNENFDLLDFEYFGSPSFGLFLDQPLYLGSLTFHLELMYFKQASVTSYESDLKNIDFVINAHTFNIPVQLRYTFYGMKVSPYISGGFVYSYNQIKDSELVYTELYDENTIKVIYDVRDYLSKRQLGYIFSLGLEYQVFDKYSIFTEVKYERLYGEPDLSVSTRFINFNIGIII